MKPGRGFVKAITKFKAKHSMLPVIVNFQPQSISAREIFRSVTGGELGRREVLFVLPHNILEMLVPHPDLAPEQAKELQELLEQQLPPDVCFVVEVNPTGYGIRRVRVGRDSVTGFGHTHVIPYCEPTDYCRLVEEFLKEQPQWLSQATEVPNEGIALTAAAVVAFARWSVAKEYTDPEVAKEMIDNVRADAEQLPGLEE